MLRFASDAKMPKPDAGRGEKEWPMKQFFGIVSVMQVAAGEAVYLLGSGGSEREARIAAFDYVNKPRGGNPYDEEFEGGKLLRFSDELAALAHGCEQGGWEDTVDESGGLVGSHVTDQHFAYMRALGRLYVVGDVLRFRT